MDDEPETYTYVLIGGELVRISSLSDLAADMHLNAHMARHYAAENEQLRAELDQARTQTGEDIVRDYYEEKSRRPSLTLRQYLKERGIPEREGYIRKCKVAYDRAHKRKRRRR
jgi:hypothetical protein